MGDISQARIVSAVLGRVRLKVPRRPGMLEMMQRTADALNSRPGVSDVQVKPRTGSILVLYDPERGNLDDLRLALQQSGIMVSEEGTQNSPSSGWDASEASLNVARKMDELNTWIGRATSGVGDLRLFMPLGLGALALHQMVRHGLKLDEIPWYVAAWYAYQSFRAPDHHFSQQSQPTATSPQPTMNTESTQLAG